MTKNTKSISDVLGTETTSESEGSIQSLFLDQEINILAADVKQGSFGDYTTISLKDSKGKAHTVHSNSKVIVDQIKALIMAKAFDNGTEIICKCTEIKSQSGKNYLKLETV